MALLTLIHSALGSRKTTRAGAKKAAWLKKRLENELKIVGDLRDLQVSDRQLRPLARDRKLARRFKRELKRERKRAGRKLRRLPLRKLRRAYTHVARTLIESAEPRAEARGTLTRLRAEMRKSRNALAAAVARAHPRDVKSFHEARKTLKAYRYELELAPVNGRSDMNQDRMRCLQEHLGRIQDLTVQMRLVDRLEGGSRLLDRLGRKRQRAIHAFLKITWAPIHSSFRGSPKRGMNKS